MTLILHLIESVGGATNFLYKVSGNQNAIWIRPSVCIAILLTTHVANCAKSCSPLLPFGKVPVNKISGCTTKKHTYKILNYILFFHIFLPFDQSGIAIFPIYLGSFKSVYESQS